MGKLFRSLTVPNFRTIYVASFLAHVGTWIHRAAQDWLVVELSDGSPAALGLIAALQFAPLPLLGLIAGVLIDRHDKRIVLSAAVIVQLVASIGIGILTLTDSITLFSLAVLTCIFGVGTAFELPCRQAFVAELVPRQFVPNAISLNSLAFNIGRSIGPALAGILIATIWHKVGPLYIVHAATVIATLISLALLRSDQLYRPARGHDSAGLGDGLRFLVHRPELVMNAMIVVGCGFFALNFQVVLAMLARRDLQFDASMFGILSSILALGAIAGATTAARMRRIRLRHLPLGAVAFGVLIVFSGLAPTPLILSFILPPLGFFALIVLTTSNTLMQLAAPAELRGRLMSVYVIVLFLGTPVLAPIIGAVGEAIGTRLTIVLGGLGVLLITGISTLRCMHLLGFRPTHIRNTDIPPLF